MACNCKQRNKIIEKYGTPEEESLLSILYRKLLKVFLFLMLLVLGVILVTFIFVVVIYKMAFANGDDRTIVMPDFKKYIKNGK